MKWKRVTVYAVSVIGVLAVMVGIAAVTTSGRATNEASVTIAKPPAVVFPWLYEPEKRQQWVGGLKGARNDKPGMPTVGSQLIDTVEMDGERTEMVAIVKTIEPERRLESTMATPTFDVTVRYDLVPDKDGTTLTVHSESVFKTWLGKLLSGTIQTGAQRKLARDLHGLKAKIEKAT
jgi:uncharacterized protein YndB with AHSA1/START domain